MELTLLGTGDYKVGAGVAYPFLELPVATGDTTIHSGAVTAAFTATQGSTTIQPNGVGDDRQPGHPDVHRTGGAAQHRDVLLGADAESSGPLPSVPCANGATIPANTLTNGQQYTLQLTAVSSPAVDQAQASLTFTATDITGTFAWTPSTVNIGTLVSFEGQGLPNNVQQARWSFGETGCDSSFPATIYGSCALGCVTNFRFKSAGTKTVTLAISMDGTTYTTVASRQLTVNNVGTCPTTCTAPGTSTNLSPSNGAQVSAGNVTFSWTAVSGTSPIAYKVMWGGMELCSSSTTSCTTPLGAGTYSWQVKATNSCGNTTSAATSCHCRVGVHGPEHAQQHHAGQRGPGPSRERHVHVDGGERDGTHHLRRLSWRPDEAGFQCYRHELYRRCFEWDVAVVGDGEEQLRQRVVDGLQPDRRHAVRGTGPAHQPDAGQQRRGHAGQRDPQVVGPDHRLDSIHLRRVLRRGEGLLGRHGGPVCGGQRPDRQPPGTSRPRTPAAPGRAPPGASPSARPRPFRWRTSPGRRRAPTPSAVWSRISPTSGRP